jgi:hypothetical protein
VASYHGQEAAVDYLLSVGANVNYRAGVGSSLDIHEVCGIDGHSWSHFVLDRVERLLSIAPALRRK